jgi:hypothetical protein
MIAYRRCHRPCDEVSKLLNLEDCRKNLPVLLAHDLGLASLLGLNVLRAPRLHEVVVVLAAQLLLHMGVSRRTRIAA